MEVTQWKMLWFGSNNARGLLAWSELWIRVALGLATLVNMLEILLKEWSMVVCVALSVFRWGIRKGREDVVCGWPNRIAGGDGL